MPNHEQLADDDDWLYPPTNVHDVDAWNLYWKSQVLNNEWLFFNDMLINDLWLARTMIDRGVQTILCAGNGISLEPHALAYYAGFHVTAADISLEATKFTRDLHPNSTHLRHFFVRGMPRAVKGSGRTLSFLVRPAMLLADYVHERYLARRIGRRGGMLVFSTGDLLDPDFCPGPSDVVIERRTVQLFPKSERDRILDRLATRLKPGGIFVSHYHMGWWRPGESREHFAEPWFRERGFTIAKGISKGAERLKQESTGIAVLFVSTG